MRTTIQIYNIVKLMRRAYLKNFQGPFFTFGFPLIILSIMGLIIISLPSIYNSGPTAGQISNMAGMNGYTLLSIVICLPAMSSSSLAIISIPQQIAQFKETVIIKRISITPIYKWQFIAAGILFGLILAFLSTLWIIAWAFILFHQYIISALNNVKEVSTNPGYIHYGVGSIFSIIIGWFLIVFIANAFGMIIAGVAKNQQVALGIAMASYFPMILLSGATLPAAYIEKSEILRIVSYIMPIKYPIEVLNISFLFGGEGIFNHITIAQASAFNWDYINFPPNAMYEGKGASLYHESIPIWSLFLICLGFIFSFSVISNFTFKWEV